MTKQRECGNKQRHASENNAENQRWSLIRSGARPGAITVYRCAHCGSWHVGHKKRRRR